MSFFFKQRIDFAPLQALAAKLPTGLNDPRALEKLDREQAELEYHLSINDRLGAVLEAGDVAYYAGKAVANGLMSQAEAEAIVFKAALVVGVNPKVVMKVAVAKYELRARPGNPKNDAAERAAAKRVLGW